MLLAISNKDKSLKTAILIAFLETVLNNVEVLLCNESNLIAYMDNEETFVLLDDNTVNYGDYSFRNFNVNEPTKLTNYFKIDDYILRKMSKVAEFVDFQTPNRISLNTKIAVIKNLYKDYSS